MLTLFTDTDTDITPVEAAEYGYKLISMPYSIDAETVRPYEDFEKFDSKAFYDKLRSGVLPTTSAISKERYREYFEADFKAGNDILYVHFSRAMTNTFDAMDQAIAELKAEYPGVRFEEIDQRNHHHQLHHHPRGRRPHQGGYEPRPGPGLGKGGS